MTTQIAQDTDYRSGFSSNRMIFKNPRGRARYYALWIDGSDVLISSASPSALSSWSSPSVVVTCGAALTNGASFSVIEDSGSSRTLIYLFWNEGLVFKGLRGYVNDSSDTIVWGTASTLYTATGTDVKPFSATFTPNGRPAVVYVVDTTYYLLWSKNTRPIESEMSSSYWRTYTFTGTASSFSEASATLSSFSGDNIIGSTKISVVGVDYIYCAEIELIDAAPTAAGVVSHSEASGVESLLTVCCNKIGLDFAYVLYLTKEANRPWYLLEWDLGANSLTKRNPSVTTGWGSIANDKATITIDPADDDSVEVFWLASGNATSYFKKPYDSGANTFGSTVEYNVGATAINRLSSQETMVDWYGAQTSLLIWEDIVSGGVDQRIMTNLDAQSEVLGPQNTCFAHQII